MNNIDKILTAYEQACNDLARAFETALMKDHHDPSETYTPNGYWIGDEAGRPV